jgi:hypothetical protein
MERSALGMADMLAWVASDAHCDAAGLRRQVSTWLAEEDDEEPWDTTHLFRWGPAFAAPPEADEDEGLDEDLDDDDLDPMEDPRFRDVPSTSSTSGQPGNRHARRRAAAERRKR